MAHGISINTVGSLLRGLAQRAEEPPAFEVRSGDLRWRVWADGRTEGFPAGSMVINHIPTQRNAAIAVALSSRR